MQRVVNENGIDYLIDGLINYFDTAKVDRPRLDYFVKVAPRYFDTQFYDIIGDQMNTQQYFKRVTAKVKQMGDAEFIRLINKVSD